jgi:hypothetical protein
VPFQASLPPAGNAAPSLLDDGFSGFSSAPSNAHTTSASIPPQPAGFSDFGDFSSHAASNSSGFYQSSTPQSLPAKDLPTQATQQAFQTQPPKQPAQEAAVASATTTPLPVSLTHNAWENEWSSFQ